LTGGRNLPFRGLGFQSALRIALASVAATGLDPDGDREEMSPPASAPSRLAGSADEQRPVICCWSGGKDSCFALHEIQKSRRVAGLLTTVTRDFDRISMHGVRRVLLARQAESLGLPLTEVFISRGATNAEYEARMGEAFESSRAAGTDEIVFGDLFLEDIRAYRDRLLATFGMTALYPVWGRDTAALIREFLALGFRTAVVCVDPAKLDPSFAGRVIDEQFLADLPRQVDPCGENGEFHTFAFDGPIFLPPVAFKVG
jgi:uncharacterized protein (TIGR00290 family)